MSAFENATQFFHACESLKGWEGCKQYVAPDAPFSAQCEPLIDVSTVEAYTEWMAGLGSGPLSGCGYDLHSSPYGALVVSLQKLSLTTRATTFVRVAAWVLKISRDRRN